MAKCQCMHNRAKFRLAHVVQDAREKHREWTEKMSACTYFVLFSCGAREKRTGMD